MIVDTGDFVDSAVNWLVSAIDRVLSDSPVCHLMLAGGGTPIPVYRNLANKSLPWDRLKLYFGDERCVPPEHPDSNYRAVTEALFPEGIPENLDVYRMRGEDAPQDAAREYASLLPERIDILLLGMGGDGHTASLFPGSPALDVTDRLVMPVIGTKPPPQRLSITPVVIQSARNTLVMVEGAGKAEAVRRALEVGDVPVALAIGGDWLMDRDAAAGLSSGE